MKHFSITLVTLLVLLLIAPTANAQASGETEVGTDAKGGAFVSQYVFYDWDKANLLTRYFWVNDVVNRAEIALGPTIKFGGTTTKLQFGGTTDRAVMIAGLAVGKIAERQIMYIGDMKVSTTAAANSFYQKVFVAIDKETIWQFRIESLHVDTDLVFLRIGGEYQIQFGRRHIYIAPFYDPVVDAPGGQVGFRFF